MSDAPLSEADVELLEGMPLWLDQEKYRSRLKAVLREWREQRAELDDRQELIKLKNREIKSLEADLAASREVRHE